MEIDKVINIIRQLREDGAIANVTGPAIPGTQPGETPPVYKKRPTIIARGRMPGARKRWKPPQP